MNYTKIDKNMLVRYLRNKENVPYGVLIALSASEIGWAFCNPKDQFNKKLGKEIALQRLLSGKLKEPKIYHPEFYDVLNWFKEKVKKFKF